MPEVIVGLVWLYVLLPFSAPFAYSFGSEDLGWKINQFYEQFCHQRVERSIFLFGQEKTLTFYTVNELKEAQAIPLENPNPEPFQWPEYFGHDYVGNHEIGWKVPLCIRDIALYGSLAIMGTIIIMRARKGKKLWKVSKEMLAILLLPMIIDGLSLTVISVFKIESVPGWYISSNLKRVITGVMFGSGAALLLIPPLLPSKRLTKDV